MYFQDSSHFANITFADKIRYDRLFQKVSQKGGESEMIGFFKKSHIKEINQQ